MIGSVDTGLVFRGHPILLGPRHIDHVMADKLVLTQLDRFIRKQFPALIAFVASDDEAYVRGALPPKSIGDPIPEGH